MVEIIKKNITSTVECDECKTMLGYSEEDIDIGSFGVAYINCPICEERVYLDCMKHNIQITHENLQYPKHFFDYSIGKKMSDDKIREFVSKVSNSLQNDDLEGGSFIVRGTGDTLVIGLKYDDEDEIIVTKNREEINIPHI